MSHQVLPKRPLAAFRSAGDPLGRDRLRLHVSFDLLIADGWSFRILGHELATWYRDPELELPPLDLSFRDCVLAEQAFESSLLYERDADYWRRRLPEFPPAPDLPLATNPAALEIPRFVRHQRVLDPERWRRLQERGTRAGLTASALLLAAFSEVLAAWAKSPRFTINLTLFNRLPLHPQVNHVVGDFTSLTLLAVEARDGGSFTDRARRLQERLWDDLDHRLFSGVRVLRELARHRGGAPRASMPVVFTSTLSLGAATTPGTGLEDLGVHMESIYSSGQTPQVWLDLQASEQNGALYLVWDVVEDLFPPGLVDSMLSAYLGLLDRLVDDPAAWADSGLHLIPVDLAIRAHVNATQAPVPDGLLQTPFLRQVRLRGNQAAVIAAERTLSYEELDRHSLSLAVRLREQGACPNRLVAIVMEKGWEQVVAAIGILRAGAAYVPIDASLPEERRRTLLQQSEAELAVAQPWLATGLEWPSGLAVVTVGDGEPALVSGGDLPEFQGPEDLAYVIFTSGSTGQPKGVMIDHRGALNTIVDMNHRFGVGPEDRILGLSSLSFDLSVYDIFGVLAAGGALVLPEPAAARDPGRWVDLMERERVTLWNSVPALMEMLVEHAFSVRSSALGSLRLALLSGDWIPVSLPDRIRELNPRLRVISLGGATEASIWSILHPIERVEPGWTSIPYGRPMVNQTFHVLNESLADCPAWVPGELFIGGIGVAKGYWRDEEKTNARFLLHPRTGERLYRTGDLGRYLPSGDIEFLGREDFQVKIQGYRIELGEIETALARHPSVRSAVVQAVGDDRANRRLLAYVVPERDRPAVTREGGESDAARFNRDEQGRLVVELDPSSLEDPLLASFAGPRIHHRFAATPLAFERFSELLACLMQVQFPESPLPKYRYPSAGSLYPVQVYLHVKPDRVSGVPGGIYYYHPKHHRLLRSSTEVMDRDLHAGTDRSAFELASFSVFLVGELAAVAPAYGELSYDFCLLEAGYMRQLLVLAGAAAAIGFCPIQGLDGRRLHPLLGLEETQLPIYGLLAGPVDTTGSTAADPEAELERGGPGAYGEGVLDPGELLSQRLQIQPLRGATALLELKLRQPGLRPEPPGAARVNLARPELSEALVSQFRHRRTYREFSPEPIQVSGLAKLLALLSHWLQPGSPRYPVQIYLHAKAGRVEGLEGGLYLYDLQAHRLISIQHEVDLDRGVHGEVNRPVFDSAAFSLFVLSERSLSTSNGRVPTSGDLLDSGAMGQALMSLAPYLQTGLCPIGSLEFDRIRPLFGLSENAVLLHSFLGGRIETEAVTEDDLESEALLGELREFLSARLPGYMVPSAFMLLDELPLSANGKVNRQALPLPTTTRRRSESYAAPESALEKKLAAIFAEVLRLDKVGVHDDLFSLGGNSLLAIQVVSKVRETLGVELPLGTLFESPTVARVAKVLGGGGRARLGAVDLASRAGLPGPGAAPLLRPAAALVPGPARAGEPGVQRTFRPASRGRAGRGGAGAEPDRGPAAP